MYPGRGYNQVSIGESFTSAMTLTESHIVMGAGLFGDINPLHVNAQFAGASRYGRRIAHGYLTSSMMAAALGMLFHTTAIAYLEHACRFTAPAHAGDTLTTTWTVTALEDKPKHGGGIVTLAGTCRDQDGNTVAEANAKMLVVNA